jgi:hypothetical protein
LVLNEHSRQVFTDIAFEAKYGEADHLKKRMFVSTNTGIVFQINYHDRTLEAMYQLHSGSITSMIINEAFCFTSSRDGYVTGWPLEFSDYWARAPPPGMLHFDHY